MKTTRTIAVRRRLYLRSAWQRAGTPSWQIAAGGSGVAACWRSPHYPSNGLASVPCSRLHVAHPLDDLGWGTTTFIGKTDCLTGIVSRCLFGCCWRRHVAPRVQGLIVTGPSSPTPNNPTAHCCAAWSRRGNVYSCTTLPALPSTHFFCSTVVCGDSARVLPTTASGHDTAAGASFALLQHTRLLLSDVGTCVGLAALKSVIHHPRHHHRQVLSSRDVDT